MILVAHEFRDDVTLPGTAGMGHTRVGVVLALLHAQRGYHARYPHTAIADLTVRQINSHSPELPSQSVDCGRVPCPPRCARTRRR